MAGPSVQFWNDVAYPGAHSDPTMIRQHALMATSAVAHRAEKPSLRRPFPNNNTAQHA
jgi:hypothetical protein